MVKITRTLLGNNQVPLLKINENMSIHRNLMNSKLKMVQQITHLHSSTFSLWEQGYLAGLRDARMSMNQIREETGASKAMISKYTSSNPEKSLRITTAPRESRGSVRYGAGQGGFSPPRPRHYTGRGGFFGGQSLPPLPSRVSPRLFPGRGPISHHLI